MIEGVAGQNTSLLNRNLGTVPSCGTAEQAENSTSSKNLVPLPRDELLLGCETKVDVLRTYNSQGQYNVAAREEESAVQAPGNGPIKKRNKRNAVVVDMSFQIFNKSIKQSFAQIYQEAQQDRRTTRILIKAMQQSGYMTENAANEIKFCTKMFMNGIARDYAQFADEMNLNEFIQSRLAREMDSVSDFLNNKNLIKRRISALPNETDSNLIDHAVSLLNGSIERQVLPINSSEPFVDYLDKLHKDLNWVDWGHANKKITTPAQ